MKNKNVIGNKYGRLTVLSTYSIKDKKRYRSMLTCLCECGETKDIRKYSVAHGITKSCGCITKELAKRKAKKMGDNNTTHSMSYSRIYAIWHGMKTRCYKESNDSYSSYGGRGITYDIRWEQFENFYTDMADGYSDGLSLERIDVNGNYCKENCCWITMSEQQKNKRDTQYLIINNEKLRLDDVSKKYNISKSTMQGRLKRGWKDEDCILPPKNRNQFSK